MKKHFRRPIAALSILLVSSQLQALPVHINEFHYDNQGADQNEFVEIAGLSGTSLDGWTLEFYNGGNNKRYMTWDLSGSFADQQAGWGVLAFTGSGGIQNGGSDGIALIDALGDLVQFISYEGMLVAADGSAMGNASVDVGVAELPSTPVGSSIQLTGTADSSEGFSWVLGSASFGELNFDQFYQTPIVNSNTPPSSVSEPSNLSWLALGALMMGGLRKRSRKSA